MEPRSIARTVLLGAALLSARLLKGRGGIDEGLVRPGGGANEDVTHTLAEQICLRSGNTTGGCRRERRADSGVAGGDRSGQRDPWRARHPDVAIDGAGARGMDQGTVGASRG